MYFAPRITVATVVAQKTEQATEQNSRFLFVEEVINNEIMLNQPAGHVEIDENPFEAACRETFEETGWHVELSHFIGVYFYAIPNNEITYLRFCFAATPLYQDMQATLDEGIIQPLWLTREDLIQRQAQHRSPLVLKCLDDYLSGFRYPLSTLYDHRFANITP